MRSAIMFKVATDSRELCGDVVLRGPLHLAERDGYKVGLGVPLLVVVNGESSAGPLNDFHQRGHRLLL